jgi:hypothetical protein
MCRCGCVGFKNNHATRLASSNWYKKFLKDIFVIKGEKEI